MKNWNWAYEVLRAEDVDELESRENRRALDETLTVYETVMAIMRRELEGSSIQ